MKSIAILGSTGSIGKNTLEVIRNHPNHFHLESISTHSNINDFYNQINEFQPKKAVISNIDAYNEFKKMSLKSHTEVLYGEEGLLELVRDTNINLIINALVGFSGLKPTIEGIKHKKDIAIANKETIVVGGEIVLNMARENNVNIIPIDSEHSALLLLLRNMKRQEVKKLILTASGGPFRSLNKEEFKNITLAQALDHPTWKMGKKITIDSSTLMNKGFEVIEAHHLFDFDFQDIEVIIHKESIIHSMIETVDGETYAQLGPTDMKFPIQNAMTYPDIIENNYHKMSLWEIGSLSFEKPDYDKFPLLKIAYETGKSGGTLPAVLNASNEIAVQMFLDNKIAYLDIVKLIEKTISTHKNINNFGIKDIFEADNWAREYSNHLIKNKSL